MSQTYISLIVVLLATILPKLGVNLGNEQITVAVSTVLTIAGAIWALIRRYKRGDVTVTGIRK